ncbi:TetR/AcrR family transcriptional regulator [Natronosporangium hydrolyticum]|uniref:TetR/AcrR family transcriptional regulator n=1 Tax=Natronosporangium hydrolyticum TaxID=2811111 RepID=A0A895YGU4_9ACTN|nr:TetR/AcrR family transcriptional regulator [Natronosporangium hydrolyticum]QSB14739.1 TetR/AcrR family transcriptional regulator [Natronosporangium hydrolyticum]
MLNARKTPRQKRSRETVAVIIEAAAQVFQREGYAATTTNKIAERAGVSIGSLYQYFPDKDALLVTLAEQELAAATEVIEGLLAQLGAAGTSGAELLRELVYATAASHIEQPRLHQLLFDEAPRLPALVTRFRLTERRLAKALAPHLERSGEATADRELAALLAIQGIAAQLHGAVLDPPEGYTWRDCVEQIITMWSRALQLGEAQSEPRHPGPIPPAQRSG